MTRLLLAALALELLLGSAIVGLQGRALPIVLSPFQLVAGGLVVMAIGFIAGALSFAGARDR